MANELTGVSAAALTRAAQEVVASAIASEFSIDPVVRPELSRALSIVASVVKRHGPLIQDALGAALAKSGRFVVLSNVAVPITKAAEQLLAAKNADSDLAKIRLRADSESDRSVTVDLVVVDIQKAWAGAYEVKRGNGTTELRKRRPTERDLKAVRLVLASHLRQLGYDGIETVTSAIIDYYGQSGFSDNLTITRDTLDEHFTVPVVAIIDAMTEALRKALDAKLPGLFAKVMPIMADANEDLTGVNTGSGEPIAGGLALEKLLTAPPVGPGPRRRQA